jgi:hypothetical protein
VDSRVFARMPEAHMATLTGQVEGLVWELTRERTFREIVVICDGKPSLWSDLHAWPSRGLCDEDPRRLSCSGAPLPRR